MLDWGKINIQNISKILLIIFHAIFIISIVIVDGYPQTNDILHIFKITPLDGNLKFINGIFGPGYTYYTLIFSNNLNILSTIILSLGILCSVLINLLLKSFTQINKDNNSIVYIISILFHLILLITIGFNHSDSIFILLLYNGILIFIYGYFFKEKSSLCFLGLLLIGISVLFRHHGIFFVFLIFLNFLAFEHYKKNRLMIFLKKYILFVIILAIPTIISQIHLYSIDALVNWQTSFKLHYFFYGDTWGNWRDLKYVLESEEIKNFNILKVNINDAQDAILSHLRGVLRIVYPFIGCFLLAFYVSKEKIILYSLAFFLIFILIVLAGYHRGYYPGIFFCYMSVLISFKHISQKKICLYLILIFLIGHLVYVTDNYSRDVIKRFQVNQDIKNNIVPFLKKENIDYQNIFSDDYNFYTNKIDGKMHRLCNWGGWFLNHPYLADYYPREVLLKNDKKYCDVKVFITRDKALADEYKEKGKFKNLYKTNFYYLLI